jgi:hypothetical protein
VALWQDGHLKGWVSVFHAHGMLRSCLYMMLRTDTAPVTETLPSGTQLVKPTLNGARTCLGRSEASGLNRDELERLRESRSKGKSESPARP